MAWSPQQDAALKAVSEWINSPGDQQIFRLFGYAGTGKTTMARHLAEHVDGGVKFAAYTGKASLVLSQKGCPAQTIHSLIYLPKGKSDQRLKMLKKALEEAIAANEAPQIIERLEDAVFNEVHNVKTPSFELNPISDLIMHRPELVIIDECSMVGKEMALDLLSFKIPILVLGDPAQLPPVGSGGYFTDHKPDVMLTEIHRQARDNPIIDMASKVRQGIPLDHGTYGNCRVVPRGTKLEPRDYDQVLVGKNATRNAINDRLRKLSGYEGDVPMVGEKLVCLRNNKELGLLNGGLFEVEHAQDLESEDQCILDLRNEQDERVEDLLAWKDVFRHEQHTMGPWDRLNADEFDFGYALTCHKAQGSQWNNVMIMDESSVFRNDASKWLYTAITRAAEKVDIVK